MSGTNDIGNIEQCESDGPQSALERHLIKEYLQNK